MGGAPRAGGGVLIMRIIMNSAMVPHEGTFYYRSITEDEVREWLSQHGRSAISYIGYPISYIGYPQIAAHVESLAGISIQINRAKCTMNVGDEALIVRLAKPQPEEWEYGILRRVYA
jgi:hypothetical protein